MAQLSAPTRGTRGRTLESANPGTRLKKEVPTGTELSTLKSARNRPLRHITAVGLFN